MSAKPTYPPLERIAELQQLIADFAGVIRAVPLMTSGRKENDVEHSYGLALTCWFLAPKIAPELNLQKVFCYALAHDVVELHAGDVFAFGPAEQLANKSKLEDEALETLRQAWPDFPELIEYAKGYKDKRDAEAKFVYTVDKILPSIMTKVGEDEDFWIRHKVTREMHEAEKATKMQHSPEAAPYLELLNQWMREPDNFYKPPSPR